MFTRHFIPEDLARQMADRANMALANSTKSNYQTVKNNISRCEEVMKCDLSFPWHEARKTLMFLAYLLFTRKVKAKTANCQLSGARMAHLELGLDTRQPIPKAAYSGAASEGIRTLGKGIQ